MDRAKKEMMNKLLPFLFTFLISILFLFIRNIPIVHAEEMTLQDLINQTAENGTLQLQNKVYKGNIVITKPIRIIGGKQTVIKGDNRGNVVSIKSPYVELKNMTVINSSMDRNSSEEYAAIKIYTDHNVIENISIYHSFHGVYLSKAHHNIIKNVTVIGKNNGTIAAQGNGLHIYYSNYNHLENNIVEGTRDGMFFDYANDNVVIRNKIKHTRYGLHYMYSDHNTFIENEFTFNTGGAAIMHSNYLVLKENQFMFNNGTQSFGVLLQSANYNQIIANKFYENQRGLYIDQSEENVIEKNKIFLNQVGVELWASSKNQLFTENSFSKNTIPVLQLGGMSENQWSKNGRGNYWGEESILFDLNQDNIGDDPLQYKSALYKLVEENELAYLFLSSPALHIYEKMNEVLHGQKIMFTDHYPLLNSKKQMTWIYALFLFIPILFFIKRRFRR